MWRINSVFLFLLLNFLTIEIYGRVIGEDVVSRNQLAGLNDFLISVVLFGPYPGEVDFVELYNPSDKDISFDYLFLANHNDDPDFKELVQLGTQDLFCKKLSCIL